jgi:hypothetical protein
MKGVRYPLEHTLPWPAALDRHAGYVLDVGAGVRPARHWFPRATRYVCVEPHDPYAVILEDSGFEVLRGAAPDILRNVPDMPDTVLMLDVIEHLDKTDGLLALALAQKIALRQVAVYTPWGFLAQTKDGWGLGGDYWQTHRSGWLPREFGPAWETSPYHPNGPGTSPEGFFAVWTRNNDL